MSNFFPRFRPPLTAVLTISVLLTSLTGPTFASDKHHQHPFMVCNSRELARLRAAYKSDGPERAVVASFVSQADGFIDQPVYFPPRGGQHNQWYQCPDCQLALKTIDDTHHKCPRCGKIYTGPPYDDVIFSRQHSRNLSHALTAAWAYALTGRAKYARFTEKILTGYAERYLKYPYHTASLETKSSWASKSGGHLYEQTLTEASALATKIAPAYDLIADTLSPAADKKIREGLLIPMLENIDRNKAGKSNWQSWHNAAMIAAGPLVDDPKWADKALNDPENGFHYQMHVSVSDEGMWYENSWGYHFYTLSALQLTAEYARHIGIDIWTDPTLRKMFTIGVQYTMADGSLPRFGDDVNSAVRRGDSRLEAAYHAYKDPEILSLLSDKPSFESILLGRTEKPSDNGPKLVSRVFKSAGHAILRTDGQASMTAAATFGPYGGFHGHLDKLSFVFFAYGSELAVDPGRARSQAYRLPIHTNWYKATLSHNTVLVDRKPQRPASGELTLFAANDHCAAFAARCTAAYPGVDHRRLLVLTDSYLLVFDRLSSDKPHTYDWLYHNRGDRINCHLETTPVTLDKSFAGAEYIENTRAAETGDAIPIAFHNRAVTTNLLMAPAPATILTLGDGVGASINDRVPMCMITRKADNAVFAAILEPTKPGQQPRISAVSVTEGPTITITGKDHTDKVTLTAPDKLKVTRDGQTLLTN